MPPKKRPYGTAQMGEERVAFLQCIAGSMSIYMDDPTSKAQENTPSITLLLSQGSGKVPFRINLGSFTEKELDYFEEFITLAIRLARPTVIERDRVAQAALEQGDDSYGRVYRQDPKLVVRPKAKRAGDEHSIHNALIQMLEDSPFVLVNPNKFKNRRTEMDFWSSDDDLEMPL
jgi:hypothetical protein